MDAAGGWMTPTRWTSARVDAEVRDRWVMPFWAAAVAAQHPVTVY